MPGDARTIKDAVREAYAGVAKGSGCCCGGAPAGDVTEFGHALGYQAKDIEGVPDGANLGLGCGAPLEYAELRPGETVLDLGSGAGFDCFVARRTVGETGQIIGVDMTPEMVAKARENARKGRFKNVEFRLGEIEHLPVADSSVDVILSNCVINLSPDKEQVYREAYRVLKPGGRLAISDVVAVKAIPAALRHDFDKHSGCVAGALQVRRLERILESVGFAGGRVKVKEASKEYIRDWFPGSGVEQFVRSADVQGEKPGRQGR